MFTTSDAGEKLRSIHDYVNFLLSFFEEFPDKVNRWECRIRDVAYDTEDIIEVFVWQRIQSRRDINMNPSHVKLEDQLQEVIQKIGSIAGEVTEERPAYRPPSSSSSSSSRLVAAGSDAVIGLDNDILEIKERLCGQSSELQVIPIVGMGGIGKSTLARTLYDDPLMSDKFDIRAWVVVSQDYNPYRFRKILLDSMRLLEKEQTSGDEMDESEIAHRVFKNLKWRRYLVVIDDVWNTEVLDDVRNMFPDDNNGSRIMLTTRHSDVAAYPDSASPLHEMRFMSDSQSWDLLKLKVFGKVNCPFELEEVGKEIGRRCAGLPLAVVLVAGVLYPVSKTRASWEEIAKNVNPVVGREIEEILSLSYTYLPHHLRPCFLFIGYFLEDINIRSSRLVRLWIAEGFVKHKKGRSKNLEEEAEKYLEDLVKRNLVIVTSRKKDGKIKSCSLHDMVRGLCMSKAGEEKFLHVRDGRYLPLMNKRRIIFSHSDKNTVWGANSLTILGFQVQDIPSMLGSYKLLRILDALGLDLKELPSEAFELYHLRYLAVMGSFSIPSLVYNLVNLQTFIIHLASAGKLQVRYDDGVPQSLPLEIWRLPQLRHLFFHAPYSLPHPVEGFYYLPLENLQILLHLKDLVWNKLILQMIPNVKRLGLHYTTSQEYHLHHLKDLHQLEKLEVTEYLDFSWRGQNPSFPCTLKKLTLVGGRFTWKDMVVVGLLPCLAVLKLLNYACDGDTWETSDEEFPQLNVLLIEESYLQLWITQSNPFPTLKHLVLRSCQLLMEIPSDIGEIPTLKLIEVDCCTNYLVESAKKIKEDQASFGNDALQVRASNEIQVFYEGMQLSSESEDQPKGATMKIGLIAGQGKDGISSMADYAALLSLAQTTNLRRSRDNILFSYDAEEKVGTIHKYVNLLLLFFEQFPKRVNPWEGRIRDLAYETEDIIDIFMWRRQMRHIVMIPSCVKLEDQLKNVTREIELIAGEVMTEENDGGRVGGRLAYLSPYFSPRLAIADNDELVGLDDDIAAIKHRLCGQSSNLQVIPIVGMGGIGKSTLARTVYEDRFMTMRFDTRAWVVVSQDYSPHKFWKILLGSITSLGKEQMSGDEMDESKNALKVFKNLKGSRYLVVIDDVWSTRVWDDVRYMFPDDNNGSRIILTTRKLDVASYLDPNSPFHEMQFMKDSQSWDFLKQKTRCPVGSEGMGREIARRCAGLPLALLLVAGVLCDVNTTRASWEEVARHVNFNVERASEDSNVKRMLEGILSLSYMLLPHHLRACFLYMGGFPENEGIRASTLIKLWVAEGFLKHENGRWEEEEEEEDEEKEVEAGEYLEHLANRNLVMVSSRKINGQIKSCSLHHLVRDFCISKAEQEQFLRVVDGRDRPQHFIFEGRRISLLQSNIEDVQGGPEIRTILCFQPLNSTPSWQLFSQSSRLLKVFASNAEEFFQLPSLFEPCHVKYGSNKIPSAISNFVNLQTLIVNPAFPHPHGQRKRTLRACEEKRSPLALEIWSMQQLRHLILHSPFELLHPLPESHPLENLQTLLHVQNLVWDVEMVRMISNVKKLGLVYTSSNRDYHLHHLTDLLQLEKLQVTSNVHFYPGEQFINTLPSTLIKLTLVGGGIISRGYMAVVGSLPNLQVLKLLDKACYGTTWRTDDGEFPKLKLLVIDESHVEDWKTQSKPLPRLKKLVLRSCQCLRNIPEGIGEVPTLELIEVVGYCRSTLLESLEKIKERFGNETLQVRTVDAIEMTKKKEKEKKKKKEKKRYYQMTKKKEEEKKEKKKEKKRFIYFVLLSFAYIFLVTVISIFLY